MKKAILLLLTILLTSCNSYSQEVKDNGKIKNGIYTCNRFEWKIKIPNGYEIRSVKDEQDLEEVGYETVSEQMPDGVIVRKNRPYLVGFGLDNRNYFSASLEPLEGTKKMSLPEHQKFIAELITDSYSTLNGIKFDQELSNKKIGKYDLYIVKEQIYNEKTDEHLLTQLIYNTYVKNHLFSVSINYTNEQTGKELIDNFEQSLLK